MPRNQTDFTLRLNKYIADCGISSRRKADELIEDGKVQVNSHTVTELGLKINPYKDQVKVRGKVVRPPADKVYLMFNKPTKVVTSTSDPEGRPTVTDFFKKNKKRLFPVGRLDWDTEGLLLMTNDGDFAQEILHPRNEIPKTYMVKLDGSPSEEQLNKLRRGVSIPDGGKVSAKYIERIQKGSKQYDWIRIIITEGRNRQIRKMFQKIGFDVKKLRRIAIGALKLGSVKKGEFRELTALDLHKIFSPAPELEREKRRDQSKTKMKPKPQSKSKPQSKAQSTTKASSKSKPKAQSKPHTHQKASSSLRKKKVSRRK